MAEKGWTVQWEDNRKHIVFQNGNGDKVRDTNLEKTFSMKVSKEALIDEFERNNEIQNGRNSPGGTDLGIRDLTSKERASREKRNNSIAEREDRDAERERQRIAAEQAALVIVAQHAIVRFFAPKDKDYYSEVEDLNFEQ